MVAFDSPEGRVIRACAVGVPSGDDARLLGDPALDWDALMHAAKRHGISALVALRAMDLAPAAPRRALKDELMHSTAVGMLQEDALAKLLGLLGRAGIEPLVFKGQPLSVEAYGGVGLRASSDIDVLVRQDDAERAATVLLDAGHSFGSDLTPREWRRVQRLLSEWSFAADRGVVDLHWKLTSPGGAFELSADELFAASRAVAVGDAVVRTFSREHLALYLAVHAAGHEWERFEWLASFHAIFQGADQGAVRALSRRLRSVRRLTLAERLAERAFGGGTAPAGDRAIEREAKRIAAGWFDEPVASGSATGRLRWKRAVYDSPADVARATLTAVFAPRLTDWRAIPLPDALSFLYPLLRPVRLGLRRLK